MRMSKKVRQNNYFCKMNIPHDVLLDSLTKVINRRYIMGYVTYLVSKKIPFSLAIIDIDNFKICNDSYGHMIGDKIIANVADIICDNCNENCFVGRYGGDEFIVVLEGDDSYDTEWKNLKNIFVNVRKPMNIDILSFNITCTAGSASFPKDGDSVEEIFNKADRTLYRGKIKGRNCFVIYVKEKHQDLKYKKEDRLTVRMDKLCNYFKGDQDFYFEIYEALLHVVNDLRTEAAGLFEVDKPPLLYKTDVEHKVNRLSEEALENHYKDGFIIINERSRLDNRSRLRGFMEDHNIRSLAAIKVEYRDKYFGYLMLYQGHIRVWQDEDMAILKYLATIIALNFYYNED